MMKDTEGLTPLQKMREQGLTYSEATPEVQDFSVRGMDLLRAWKHRVVQGGRYLLLMPYSVARVRTPDADIHYLGHHKCASNWMRCFLLHLAPYLRFNYVVERGRKTTDFRTRALSQTVHLNVNADVESMKAVPESERAFHLIRDPRDALVSEYFSRKLSHGVRNQWNIEVREYLHAHSLEEGLLFLMDQHIYFMQMEGWDIGRREHILDIKYEDLLTDELGGFARILDHLDIGLPRPALARIVRKCSFESLSGGRKRGAEDKTKHFRKGVAGDWKNYMPPDGRVYGVFRERFGSLVERLGYDL